MGVRRWKLANKYGITHEQYEEMFQAQGGLCAICGNPPADPGTNHGFRLKVDHDHETGVVRGLLCNSCNLRLGWVEKHRDTIQAYLTPRQEHA